MWQIRYLVNNLVSQHRGTLPVILTCPHDGDEQPQGVPKRERDHTPRGCNFDDTRDLETRTITVGVAQRLLDNAGEAPYVVLADFDRDYIDANRPAANGDAGRLAETGSAVLKAMIAANPAQITE